MRWLAAYLIAFLLGVLVADALAIRALAAGLVVLALLACG